ncbi:MAG: hypothetical protein B6D56_05415 [Candidatus Omnitrophica bacterium 4484_70.1]|nr:MAG: hypothetical protein B6D56_05415 [Candidatus Omnitrophica bacterium 4484_70.1]
MIDKKIFLFVLPIIFTFIYSHSYAQSDNTFTLTTYYPSPFGVYRCLRLYPYNDCGKVGGVCEDCDSTNNGTMCYNGKEGALYICNGKEWQIASGLWKLKKLNDTESAIYPRDLNWKVGIGTDEPDSKLVIKDTKDGLETTIRFGHKVEDSDESRSGIVIVGKNKYGVGILARNESSEPVLVPTGPIRGYAGIAMENVLEGGVALYVSDEPDPGAAGVGGGRMQGFRITAYRAGGKPEPIEFVIQPEEGTFGDSGHEVALGLYCNESNKDIIVELGHVYGRGDDWDGDVRILGGDSASLTFKLRNGERVVLKEDTHNYFTFSSADKGFKFDTDEGFEFASSDVTIKKDLYVDGAVYASDYYDIAENFLVKGNVEEGDVVVVDLSSKKGVIKSKRPYSPLVVGVISKNPAIIIGGKKKKNYKPVALKGVVLAKVIGPVKRGDILVTSDKEGYAMKANLKKIFSPTQIVGIALDELKEKEGKIRVFIK